MYKIEFVGAWSNRARRALVKGSGRFNQEDLIWRVAATAVASTVLIDIRRYPVDTNAVPSNNAHCLHRIEVEDISCRLPKLVFMQR